MPPVSPMPPVPPVPPTTFAPPGGMAPSAPGRRPGRASAVVAWLGLTAAFILLVVVIVQTVLLVQLSERADEQASQLRASEERQRATEARLDGLSKQIAGVDDRTKGALNSAAVARKVLPSVFRVRAGDATGTAFAFGAPAAGGGTLLITNYHVVESVVDSGSRAATLERKSERYPARIVKLDERRDIAVLQATKAFPRLSPIRDDVQPGQPVIVVGAPLGLSDTVTTGVVSAVRSGLAGINTKVIQFDAAINPGNSGGPVINADGLVVGVAQAKIIEEDADGLALAIPISEVCDGLVGC